jgi:hypothetical protein
MKKAILALFAVALLPAGLFAVDGQVLISQASVTAAGGFPYVITQAGSYKLSGNLTPPNNVDAIHINSNNVTLDLNGFTIGSAACVPDTCGATSAYGVFSSTTHAYYNITIRNGTVSGMGAGIYLNGDSITVEDLHIRNIVNNGITITWSGGNDPGSVIVRHNTIDGARVGLSVTGSALVTDNTFSFNLVGASIGNEFGTTIGPAMVKGNTFYSNTLGLTLYHGGYLNNAFSGGGPVYGKNLGGNLCNNVACP